MPAPDNRDRIDGLRDPNERWLDGLLAADREHVQKTAQERIASGMHRRIIEAHAQRGHSKKPAWQWTMASVGAATLILVLWIAVPRRTAPSPIATSLEPIPGPTAASANGRVAANMAHPPMQSPANPRPVRIRALDRRKQAVLAKQAVFPSNVVATEEERLLIELARNHPEKVQEISEMLSEQEKQEKAHRQSFEEWLRQGEQR